ERRHEIPELGDLGTDQQVADEQRMPGVFAEDAGLEAMPWVGTRIEILAEQLLALGVRQEILMQAIEMLRLDRAVVVPPHIALGERILDDELVLWRAPGMRAGFRGERSAIGKRGLARGDRMLVEEWRGQVPMQGFEALETELVCAEGGVAWTDFPHGRTLRLAPAGNCTGAPVAPSIEARTASFPHLPPLAGVTRQHRPVSTNQRLL